MSKTDIAHKTIWVWHTQVSTNLYRTLDNYPLSYGKLSNNTKHSVNSFSIGFGYLIGYLHVAKLSANKNKQMKQNNPCEITKEMKMVWWYMDIPFQDAASCHNWSPVKQQYYIIVFLESVSYKIWLLEIQTYQIWHMIFVNISNKIDSPLFIFFRMRATKPHFGNYISGSTWIICIVYWNIVSERCLSNWMAKSTKLTQYLRNLRYW